MIRIAVTEVRLWDESFVDDYAVKWATELRGATIHAKLAGPPATPLEDLMKPGAAYILTEKEATDLASLVRLVANIPADIELPRRARALLAGLRGLA